MIQMPDAVVRARAGLGKCLLLLSLGSLGACASFEAHPRAVLNPQLVMTGVPTSAYPNGLPIPQAIENYYGNPGQRNNLSQQDYRNYVIGVYLMAADQRFNDFRRHLSTQSRGSNFGLDLGILGSAGGASIATGQRTANILSAIAAGVTGTRAALNRDVFFDRTLPALFAAMDSTRTEIRTTIMLNMRRSAADYPLPVALADLANYENAGSLDGAVQRVTAEAVRRADEAQRNYDTIQHVAAIIPPEAVPLVRQISDNITRLMNQGKATDIASILRTLNRPVQGTLQDQTIDAIREVNRLSGQAGALERLVVTMRTQGVELAQ